MSTTELWILDTDTCIELQRGRSPRAARLVEVDRDGTITIVSLAELHYGASKSARLALNRPSQPRRFLQPFEILQVRLRRGSLLWRTEGIPGETRQPDRSMDILIEAIALGNDAILVTNNVRDFSRVPELRIENWVRGPSAGCRDLERLR